MASKIQMEFKKGDHQTHFFQILADAWTPGGLLHFAAKPAIDNDQTDSAASIDKSFDDNAIVSSSHEEYLENYVTYQLSFVPDDTNQITFTDGTKKLKYLGEFQYVSSLSVIESFPSDDEYIEVLVYADVKRGTT